MLGVTTVNTMATFAVMTCVMAGFFAAMYPDFDAMPVVVVLLAVAVVLPFLLQPVASTVWAAIDLAMHPLEPAEEADALTWVAAQSFERTSR